VIIGVSGSFDDLAARHVRLLQEAARRGPVRVHLWSDDLVVAQTGALPKFPLAERRYFVSALRYVSDVQVADALPSGPVVTEASFLPEQLAGFPPPDHADDVEYGAQAQLARSASAGPRVIITGSFDWLHSGHVRFFEEVSSLGTLYAVVGHDANIRLLKGEGHPLIGQAERLYMVQSIRYVHRAMLSTGHGWLDAEPEIEAIRPAIYAVNEDGDKPEKRAYCAAHGIEYVVLKRQPREGLSRRSSTELRGF
jgi:cytidyltransferase-like protein